MRYWLACLCFLFALPVWADQLIIEPDMGREPILSAIQHARHSIKLVMYGLTDDSLINALIKQKQLGRTLNIILEQAPYNANDENAKAIGLLNANSVNWKGTVPPYKLIHQKTLLIDGKEAIVMTFNFTRSTFKKERNFALIVDNPKIVRDIDAIFAADWNHVPSSVQSSSVIASPDNSRDVLLRLIRQAKKSIHVYAQSLNDYAISGALAKAAHKGVDVQVLTSAKLREKQANYLQQAGINIHYSQHYYIHAKVMIIDNQKAVLGSINFTKNSLDHNRELAVVTNDETVINLLNQTFSHDWNIANGTMSSTNLVNDAAVRAATRLMKKYLSLAIRTISKYNQ